VATDFFTVEAWTGRGLSTLYVLVLRQVKVTQDRIGKPSDPMDLAEHFLLGGMGCALHDS
jgi:hypothetical protein